MIGLIIALIGSVDLVMLIIKKFVLSTKNRNQR